MEKKRVLKTIQRMLNIPEETSYRERNRICRREEIWQERHWQLFEAFDKEEEGPEREEEMRRFWWAFDNDNFTLMYGQEMNALINCKISMEEAERAVRQAQRVEIEEEEDLSEEEESSEEEVHQKEDIEEDKTNRPNRDPYPTAFAIIETTFNMMDEVDEDLWNGDSGASSHLIGSEKDVFDKKMIEGSVNTAKSEKMKIRCEGKVNVSHFTKTGYKRKATLSAKVVEGLKIKLFSFTTTLSKGWKMNGYKQKMVT